jgi:hypothetical protein
MGRGPSYPYVGLEEAISLTQKMYDFTKRVPAPVDSITTGAWKYTTTSSSGIKVLAALKAFGLVEDAASASGKSSIKVTPRAIRILLDDQNSAERREEIQRAALSPKWYEYCWKTWGKAMPASMKSVLLIEHGFVDSTVESFLKDYRKTMAFAGLLDDVLFGENNSQEEKSDSGPEVGDWVQCDMEGQLRLPEPLRLIRIENHAEHGKFGFVEGQKGGIEYKHLVKVEPPLNPKVHPLNSFNPPPMSHFSAAIVPPQKGETKMETESFSLSNGLTAQVQWPSVMTEAAYKRFEYFLEGVKMSVKQAISNTPRAEVESRDEEAAKEEHQKRMERSS